jgi:hypothetical protein
MKQLLYVIVLSLFFTACKKEKVDQLSENKTSANTPLTNEQGKLQPVPPYEWTALTAPLNAPGEGNPSIVIPVNGTAFCVIGHPEHTTYKLNTSTKRWELFTSFEVFENYNHSLFSYQSKIYQGMSVATHQTINNFFSIDVTTGVRTSLAAFPGTPCRGCVSFVIGDKGYLLGGITQDGTSINQAWEYNFTTNQWTNKNGSPLGARVSARAFVVDDKAYIGLGYDVITLNGQTIHRYKNDWIKYDPNSVYSGIMAPFPGTKRSADGFVINNNPYVGLGGDADNTFTDFWKYNVSSNTWTQQDSWPGEGGVSTFAIGNVGYLVKAPLQQFWKFSNSPF